MTQALSLQVAGLATDPGPFTAAPDGAMVEAQNVVVIRPGVLEPRPGALMFKDSTIKSGGQEAIAVYSDANGVVWTFNSGGTDLIRKDGATTITGPTTFSTGRTNIAPTGGRALVTTNQGVITLPAQLASPASGSATVAYRAGMPWPIAPTLVASTVQPWLATNYAVAYRCTLRRRLADGTIVESAPSSRAIFRNNSGGSRSVAFDSGLGTLIYQPWIPNGAPSALFNDLIAGDELVVYRSPSVTPYTNEPTDEMTERAVLTLDTTNNSFSFTDSLPDAEWTGSALYTNDTQEGALAANFRPEYARDIALYNGMTFYAGARGPQTVQLTLTRLGTATDPSQTIKSFAFTGDTTNANPTILNVTNVRSFSVGQYISSALPYAAGTFPANTKVLSINVAGNSITCDKNATATLVGAGLYAWDWISVTESAVEAILYHYPAGAPLPANYFTSTAGSMEVRWAIGDVSHMLRTSGLSETEDIGITFFQPLTSSAAFVVKTSKPLAFDRYVDAATGVTSQQPGSIAELRWSKLNEPEHCPVLYRTTVGDAAYAIRRIVVARNSLLVFKDDGLFQAYGKNPADLTFELLDRTILIPYPKDAGDDAPCKWVGRFDDRVYAMTTRGPMQIGDSGARPVGAPILESLRRRFIYAYGANDESTRALMIDPQARRVGFFYDLDGNGISTAGYVMDADTGIWTYWTFARPMGGFTTYAPFGTAMFAGDYFYGYMLDNRSMLDDGTVTVTTLPNTCDSWPSETCTINTVTGTGPYTITIAAASEWTPVVGDLLIRSGVAHLVTAITSATVFSSDTQPTTGAATWKESYECRCVWSARTEGNVGVEKEWLRLHIPFELQVLMSRYTDSSTSIGRLKGYFRGYRNTDAAIEQFVDGTQTIGVTPWPIEPSFKSIDVPRDVAIDWALRVGFSIRQACVWFATAGMTIEYEVAGMDVGR